MFCMMKSLYILQPYSVGSKKGKSLVVLIPSEIVKKYKIDTSTAFALRGVDKTNSIVLYTLSGIDQKMVIDEKTIQAGSLDNTSEQTSTSEI